MIPVATRRARKALTDEHVTRLPETATCWVDGGPLHHWAPVHSRFAKPIASPGRRPQVIFTRTPNPPDDAVIRRWLEHQRGLVVPTPEPGGDHLVFWRLAVRQRAFAIDVQPRSDLGETVARAQLLIDRASRLRVTLGFFIGELTPSWVVRDGDEPVFVGLPDHHLVPTEDPSQSLAAMLASARIRSQVHDVVPEPRKAD